MKSYTSLIDQALLQKQANDESNYFPLRPSAAGYCSRRLAYDLMDYMGFSTEKYKEEKEAKVIRLLNLGSSIEWHSIRNFEQISSIDPEIKIKYKQQSVVLFPLKKTKGEKSSRLIEGSIDFAVQDGEFLDIYDVKSKADKFSASFKTDWDASVAKFNGMKTLDTVSENCWYADNLESFLEELNDGFFAHNFHQINAYANTEWAKQHNVRHGGVYRYCKNDSRHIEIKFRPSKVLYEKLEEKFNLIYTTVMETKNPDLVPKDCWLGNMVTAFSRCKDCCWKEDALKAYFKTFPKKEWPTDVNPDSEMDDLVGTYEALETHVKEREQTEEAILKLMVESQLTKIRLENGNVYEAKHLKSPRPHFELRRSKA